MRPSRCGGKCHAATRGGGQGDWQLPSSRLAPVQAKGAAVQNTAASSPAVRTWLPVGRIYQARSKQKAAWCSRCVAYTSGRCTGENVPSFHLANLPPSPVCSQCTPNELACHAAHREDRCRIVQAATSLPFLSPPVANNCPLHSQQRKRQDLNN